MHILHSGIDSYGDCASAAIAYFHSRRRKTALQPEGPQLGSHLERKQMAHVSDIRSSGISGGSSLTARFAEMREAMTYRFEQRREYRRTVNELSNLTNRELADLGIHRSNIGAVAMEAMNK